MHQNSSKRERDVTPDHEEYWDQRVVPRWAINLQLEAISIARQKIEVLALAELQAAEAVQP